MILYFSATGNSRYIALGMAERLHDDVRDIAAEIKGDRTYDDSRLIIVSPVYYYGPPSIVEDFIKKMKVGGDTKVYLILNFGSYPGLAGERFESLMEERGIQLTSRYEIRMPENYILMFDPPGRNEIDGILDSADLVMDRIASMISSGSAESIVTGTTFMQRAISRMARPFYERRGTRRFHTTTKCMRCGRCVDLCPAGVISFSDRAPHWKREGCIRCTACINLCPFEAIEYGLSTKGRKRYRNPRC